MHESILVFFINSVGDGQELFVGWELTSCDKNLSSCPTKNSSKRFVHDLGKLEISCK
jgi:hypothetical protein